jgi:hypothetical protein
VETGFVHLQRDARNQQSAPIVRALAPKGVEAEIAVLLQNDCDGLPVFGADQKRSFVLAAASAIAVLLGQVSRH